MKSLLSAVQKYCKQFLHPVVQSEDKPNVEENTFAQNPKRPQYSGDTNTRHPICINILTPKF